MNWSYQCKEWERRFQEALEPYDRKEHSKRGDKEGKAMAKCLVVTVKLRTLSPEQEKHTVVF